MAMDTRLDMPSLPCRRQHSVITPCRGWLQQGQGTGTASNAWPTSIRRFTSHSGAKEVFLPSEPPIAERVRAATLQAGVDTERSEEGHEMADWRFYGRVEELAKLEGALQLQETKSRGFCAVRITGRRGVGKAELLTEAGRRGTRNAPLMTCRLPSGGDSTQAVADLVATI